MNSDRFQSPRLDPAGAKGAAADNAVLIDQVTRELRTISHLLHPPLLEEVGLPSAPPTRKAMALTSFAQLGVGVRGMRERVGQLGGVLVVQSDPGSTVVTATLPIRVTTIVTRSEEVV